MRRKRRVGQLLLALSVAAAIPPLLAYAEETLDAHRERIEAMSAEERDILRNKQERFFNLPPDEQQRLRKLHDEISSHPKAAELHEVLTRYNEWLRTLSAVERAELLGLPVDARIAQIKELMEKQQWRSFGFVYTKLPMQDVPKIFKWVNQYVDEHEQELIDSLPDSRREDVRVASPGQLRRMLLFTLVRRRGGPSHPEPDQAEIDDLLKSLSKKAQDVVANEREESRKELVQRWIQTAILAELVPRVDDNDIKRFYNEELTEEERASLDSLSPELQTRRLRMMYHYRHFRRPGDPRPPGERSAPSENQQRVDAPQPD